MNDNITDNISENMDLLKEWKKVNFWLKDYKKRISSVPKSDVIKNRKIIPASQIPRGFIY